MWARFGGRALQKARYDLKSDGINEAIKRSNNNLLRSALQKKVRTRAFFLNFTSIKPPLSGLTPVILDSESVV